VYIDSLKLSDRWESLDVIGMDGRYVISYLNIVGKTKAEVNLARFSPGKYIIRLRKKTGERTLIKIIKI
jgi:predicted RNA-binding protein